MLVICELIATHGAKVLTVHAPYGVTNHTTLPISLQLVVKVEPPSATSRPPLAHGVLQKGENEPTTSGPDLPVLLPGATQWMPFQPRVAGGDVCGFRVRPSAAHQWTAVVPLRYRDYRIDTGDAAGSTLCSPRARLVRPRVRRPGLGRARSAPDAAGQPVRAARTRVTQRQVDGERRKSFMFFLRTPLVVHNCLAVDARIRLETRDRAASLRKKDQSVRASVPARLGAVLTLPPSRNGAGHRGQHRNHSARRCGLHPQP